MSLLPRPRRLVPLALAALLAAGASGCNDPFRVRATLDVVEDTLVVSALSDTTGSPGASVALSVADFISSATPRGPRALRLTPAFAFDVAFDIRGDTLLVLPPRLVASRLTASRRVGLRRDSVAFESVTRAAKGGYQFDSVAVRARVGDVVTLVVQSPQCSQAREASNELYAKIGVLAVDAAARRATIRVRVDPNCGFRSFLPGIPNS